MAYDPWAVVRTPAAPSAANVDPWAVVSTSPAPSAGDVDPWSVVDESPAPNAQARRSGLPMAQRYEGAVASTAAQRIEAAGQGAPEIAAEQGMVPEPTQKAPDLGNTGIGRIAEAAKQGFIGSPPILPPAAQDWLEDRGLGRTTMFDLPIQLLGAGLSGATQAAYEAATGLGMPETLARDIAANVENMGMSGAPHGGPTDVGLAYRMDREPRGSPAVRAAVRDVAANGLAAQAAERPTPEAPPGTGPSLQANIDRARQTVAEARQAQPAAPSPTPMLDRMAQTPEQAALAEEAMPTVTVRPQPGGRTAPVEPPVPGEERAIGPAPAIEAAPAAAAEIAAPPRPVDAVTALIDAGGVRDPGGDLAAIGADESRHRFAGQFLGRLINDEGMSQNRAREFLRDNGYLTQSQAADDRIVHDVIADHASGNPTFRYEDLADAHDFEQARAGQAEYDRFAQARGEAQSAAIEIGAYVPPDLLDHAGMLVMEGLRPDEALRNAALAGDAERGLYAQRVPRPPEGAATALEQPIEPPRVVDDEARARLTDSAQRMLRSVGLPSDIGVRVVDRITDAAGNSADAHYTRNLISLALDTPPELMPQKLFHEGVHGLMDPALGLLSDAQRQTLLTAADRWLGRGDRRQQLMQHGYTPEQLREEAVARMGEDALNRGIKPPVLYQRMLNFVGRIGNWLRGEGYRTADDVFDSILRGEVRPEAGAAAGTDGAFARRDPAELTPDEQRRLGFLGRTVQRVIGAASDLAQSIADGLAPMQGGTRRAQAFAANFANSLRQVQYRFGEIDREIERNFTPSERAAMGTSLDAQSVFEQQIRDLAPQEQASVRADFDAAGSGLAGLNDKQRRVVEALNVLSQRTWEMMKDRGLVAPNAAGIPYYFPRQILAWAEREGFTRPGATREGAGRGLDDRGRNLTTSGPMRREHLTPEETEAAARAKLGANVAILNDIRSLPARLAFSQRAVAGVDLINAIERVGKETGVNLVLRGDIPGLLHPGDYFTMSDHPAFRRWSGNGWQAVHVAREFEGPLKAVLTQPSKTWYRAAQGVKGGVMSAIMWSPFIHLQVEIGRSLPQMLLSDPVGTLTLKMMRDGSRVRRDPEYMDVATRDGVAPLGQTGGWRTDPVSIADQANVEGRNRFVAAIAGIRDAVANAAGRSPVAGQLLHDVVQHPHQTLLWDQVFNLQMGLYDTLKEKWTPQYGEQVAGTMAAHIANRYAGALPPEHLSRGANMAANLLLFSRSFTLGNLGVMKDMLNGAPSHVLARVEQIAGPEVAQSAQSALRRKAISAFVMDIGLYVLAGNLAQLGFQALWRTAAQGMPAANAISQTYEDWLDKAKYAVHAAASSPLEAFGVLPQHWNEPGKQGRVRIGTDQSGRDVYGRLPLGKVGEEFLGYFTHPGELLMSKLSPMVRPIAELAVGYDSLGRELLPPHPKTIGDYIETAGAIVKHIGENLGPVSTVQGLNEMFQTHVMGKPTHADPYVTAAKVLGPATGLFQMSQGFPGGAAAGEVFAEGKRESYDLHQALPDIRNKILEGDVKGAVKQMTDLRVPAALQLYYVNQTMHPGMTPGAGKRLMNMPADVQERVRHQAAP